MPNSRFYDRRGRSHLSVDQGQTAMAPSSGVASVGFVVPGAENVSDDMSEMLKQFRAVYELGRPFMVEVLNTDASSEDEIDVPTGKYWRLIGGFLRFTAAAEAQTRTPIITIEQTDDTALDTITLPTKTTGQVEDETWLFGTTGNVSGNLGVAAEGRLTIGEQITAGDTMTIDTTVYTFIAAGTSATTAQSPSINLGANEAATKVLIENELLDGNHPTVLAKAAFVGDNLDLFARDPGLDVETLIALTETFTNGANVFANATLGDQTEGVEYATELGTLDYPTNGVLLVPTDKIVINVTNGHADDEFRFCVFGLEFDNDPRNSA